MIQRPEVFFIVKGSSEGDTALNIFDNCLISAGISDVNLVKVSSIVPPGCEKVSWVDLPAGSIVPIAYAFRFSDMRGELISAAIAVAIPEGREEAGLIMEYSAATTLDEAKKIVKGMAEKGFINRNRKLKEVYVDGVEHRVQDKGGVFAGVVLWYKSF